MASTASIAAGMSRTHRRTMEVLEDHASEERLQNIKHLGAPSMNDPARQAAIQQEQIAALAEMYEELASKQASSKKK